MDNGPSQESGTYDVFVSYASEDRAAVAKPIAEALMALGWVVWFDEFELRVGDSLMDSLNQGIAQSTAGLLIISPTYLARDHGWARIELDGLVARQILTRRTLILPVWHEVSAEEVTAVLPTLGGRKAADSSDGPQGVAQAVSAALHGRISGASVAQAFEQARQMRARRLVEVLEDQYQRPSLRRRAARELGALGGSRACDVLIRHLAADPDERVRDACANGLGRLRDARAHAPLVEALKDPSDRTRMAAAVALQRMGSDEGLGVLQGLLEHRNAGMRDMAAVALRNLKRPETFEALVRALSDEHGPVRQRAAEALAALNDPRATEPLLDCLRDETDEAWGAIAWAVAQLRQPQAAPTFAELLGDRSISPERRSTAAYGLGLIGGPLAATALTQAVRTDPDDQVRKEAIWALMELRSVDPIPTLREVAGRATDPERRVAIWAIEYLSRRHSGSDDVDIDHAW
jgi:HEAT repeat protein